MRTSNKILLGVFLTGLAIITALHIALFAKYKAGDITTVEPPVFKPYETYKLLTIKHISVEGLDDVWIDVIGNADTTYLEIGKEDVQWIQYKQLHDTLLLQLDAAAQSYVNANTRTSPRVKVFIPALEKITALDAGISLGCSLSDATSNNYTVELNGSQLFINDNRKPEGPLYVNNITINANNSQIEFGARIQVKELNVNLHKSKLADSTSRFEKISVTMDDSSHIDLKGYNLKKANLIINEK